MAIYITGLSSMPDLIKQFDVRDLVSIIGSEFQPPTPPEIEPSRHHRCSVDDIVEAKSGRTVPQAEHVKGIIEFLNTWDTNAGLLIHCMAGVSRSTAVALIAHTLKTNDPEQSAIALRKASPYAWPNPRIVSLADAIMGLDGSLVRALNDMGPANWEIEPDYIVPRLQGNDARGYEPGRYSKLII